MAFLTALPFFLIAIIAAPAFFYLYVVLRWRAGPDAEPGIGSYSLVLFFRITAILLVFGGAATIIYTWLSSEDVQEVGRMAWGVFVAGLLFLMGHLPLGRHLRPAQNVDAAMRLFGGFLLAQAGIIAFGALVLLCVTLFEDVPEFGADNRIDQIKLYGTWFVLFGALYGAVASRMRPGTAPGS